MSPLDGALRAALHGRAQALAPSPDPLAGIERRARRIQRNRVGAAVAGSVLAVGLVAAAVPAIQTAATPQQDAPRVAATPAPTPVAQQDESALDPRSPWPYRGASLDQLGPGTLETVEREYARRRGAASVELTPLFGQLYDPSQQVELVFLAEVGAEYRWGVARSSEAGPELLWDEALPSPAYALAAALPGDDGVSRLLVVASPEVSAVQYGHNAATEFADMARLAEGVAVTPLEGEPATDSYRVLDAAGDEVVRAPAPDLQPGGSTEPTAPDRPDNLLDWGFRGQEDAELEGRAVGAYADSKGVAPADVGFFVLFTGDNDPGQRFTLLQVWTRGRPAQVVGFVDHPELADELVLQPPTDPDEPVVALLLTATPGQTSDELVVVPTPGTGQVLYAADGDAQARAVEPAPGLDGVVLIDRERGVEDDRLTVLDGNGDLDRPLYDGTVAALLCGETGCG